MNDIKKRAHEYAQEHILRSGASLMRAYIAGALSERTIEKQIKEEYQQLQETKLAMQYHRIKIFISGKVSGEDYYKTYAKFAQAEKELEKTGYKVINPMVLCGKHWSWLRCMAVCLWHLCRAKCLYQLPDWHQSRGAKLEYKLAILLKKDIITDGRNIKQR